MAWSPPPLPQQQPDWLTFQVWWQQVIEDIQEQFTVQGNALADIQAALALGQSSLALTLAQVAAASAPPPAPPSGGGSSDSVSSFTPFSALAPVSDVLTAVAGAGGIVTLTAANLAVTTEAAAPSGTFRVYAKWQWDSTGAGVWVDVAPEVGDDVSVLVTSLGGYYAIESGELSCTTSKTGLVAASSHKFRLLARVVGGSRTMYLTGTASAVGS